VIIDDSNCVGLVLPRLRGVDIDEEIDFKLIETIMKRYPDLSKID
jgi:hypothetical protein